MVIMEWGYPWITIGPQEGWGSMAHRVNKTQYTECREHTEWTVRSDIRQTLVKPRWNLYTRSSPAVQCSGMEGSLCAHLLLHVCSEQPELLIHVNHLPLLILRKGGKLNLLNLITATLLWHFSIYNLLKI